MATIPPRAVLASRTLDVDGRPAFHLRVASPAVEPDGETWRCEYEVDGPLTRHRGSMAGVDAMQALLNALYILSVEAETSEENRTGRLTWGGQSAHFGLPAPEADPERRG